MWGIVRALLGLAGLGFVGWLVGEVGLDALMAVITPALAWLPLAAALELARIAMDAVSTRYTLGRRAKVPALPLVASHLVAYAVMGVAPAGRATSEAVKAALLSRFTGGGSAAAMGTANQANTLIASGVYTIFGTAASFALTGASVLTYLLAVHTVTMSATGLALRFVARHERAGAWVARRLPRLAPHVGAFHETSRETALFPVRPVAAMVAGRALQTACFGVLAVAVGLSPGVLGALALHGVYLVVAALGVMIPGQLGASEGGFALAAETLRASVPQAMAIALLAHAIQLALVAAGFVVLALWRPSGSRPS